MSSKKIINVGGASGVDAMSSDELKRMFANDPMNTLGWLHRPYQEAAVSFRYDAAKGAWSLARTRWEMMFSGVGSSDTQTGFLGEQNLSGTSLLRDGGMTSDAYFTTQGLALRLSRAGYTPDALSDDMSARAAAVSRDGVLRLDTARLAGRFAEVFLDGTSVELYQSSRECYVLMGKAVDFTAAEPVPFKRTFVFPPGGGAPQFGFRLETGRSIAVPRDKKFAEPDDGAVVAFTLRLDVAGYCCDADGTPLVTAFDNAEALQSVYYLDPIAPAIEDDAESEATAA